MTELNSIELKSINGGILPAVYALCAGILFGYQVGRDMICSRK